MNKTRRSFLKTIGTSAALPFAAVPGGRIAAAEPSGQVGLQELICASVRDLGLQFLDNPLQITGLDGATSTPLPNGDAFWLFGDTIEGPFETIRNHDLTEVLSNTASVVPAQDVLQGIKKFEYLKSDDGKRPRR